MNEDSKKKRIAWAEAYHTKRRELLQRLVEPFGDEIVGALVGVWDGEFAERLLTIPEVALLYGVDPYVVYTIKNRVVRDWLQPNWDVMFEKVKGRLNGARDRFKLIRERSETALVALPALDFAIVDGDPSFESVTTNIELLEEKLIGGGLLCGDLYWAKPFWAGGVRAAVDAYAERAGRRLETDKDTWMWWWYVR